MDPESPGGPCVTHSGQRQPGARYALLLLGVVNLLNFADRYVASAIKEPIKADLGLTDAETSYPTTGMAVVFIIFASFFGLAADRDIVDRRVILAGGVMLWSVATALAGLAQDLKQLIFFRALVGVGEAAYGVIAGPMILDYFPPHERTAAFAVYNLAIPVGGALGYAAGAVLGSLFSWRVAFMLVGGPGALLALGFQRMTNPVRGLHEHSHEPGRLGAEGEEPVKSSGLQDLKLIIFNPHYVVVTCGLVAINFAIGGLADWVASYLQRYDGASMARAGIAVGAMTAIGGIGGNLIGAKTAGYLSQRHASAEFLSSAIFTVPSAAMTFLAINLTGSEVLAYALLLLGEIFLWTYLSPIQNVSLSVIPARLRSRSSGLQIFCTHVLGDVISPPIIGVVSDSTGSLHVGMQLTWVMMLVAGCWWFAGYACLPPLHLDACSHDAAAGHAKRKPASLFSLLAQDQASDVMSPVDSADTSDSADCKSAEGCSQQSCAE